MTRQVIIVFSVGLVVGCLIGYGVTRLRNRRVYEDYAGETKPVIA
ncbi:hypothetical protein [Mucilaginibacter mali]|nr:hypothetical protein [Mucilaginibacter mali]